MLSNLEERLERSIFEELRKVLVSEGYLPNIEDNVRYPFVNGKPTALANANWDADLATIAATKGFAIELFNYSSSDAKGTKKVPRIVIESNRTMTSELGAPSIAYTLEDPNNASQLLKQPLPFRASTFYFDIHLVGNSARQIRILNSILSRALANVKYIPFYDTQDLFFIQQTGYFEVPGQQEGIEEKVYSYEVPDLYDLAEVAYPIAKMRIIDVFIEPIPPGEQPDLSTNPSGDSIHIENGETDFT